MTWEELIEKCTMTELTQSVLKHCNPFSCDNADLDEFFAKDALLYRQKLLGKTYFFLVQDNF